MKITIFVGLGILGHVSRHLGGVSGRLRCILGRHKRVFGGVGRPGLVLRGLQEPPRASWGVLGKPWARFSNQKDAE